MSEIVLREKKGGPRGEKILFSNHPDLQPYRVHTFPLLLPSSCGSPNPFHPRPKPLPQDMLRHHHTASVGPLHTSPHPSTLDYLTTFLALSPLPASLSPLLFRLGLP